MQIVQEYERAVIFRLGRIAAGGAKGPGISITQITNLLVAKYFPRAKPVQHVVNPGQLVQAVSRTQ